MPKFALATGHETEILIRTLSPKLQAMLSKAVGFMTNAKDLTHGIDHINNLLKNAKRFFESTGNTFDIDKEILLLALFWHDVWKSQHKLTMVNYLFHQWYEGLGSMLMFRKYARVVGLSPAVIRSVSYAIRKHAAVPGPSAKTLEAQLLWDVDTLDIWNSQRTKSLFKNVGGTKIFLLDSYLRYMKKVGLPLHFEWTRNEVRKLKPLFLEEMSKFRESLVNRNRQLQHSLIQPNSISPNPFDRRSSSSVWDLDDKY